MNDADSKNDLPDNTILFLDLGTWDTGPEDGDGLNLAERQRWFDPQHHTRFYFAFNADRGTPQAPSWGTFVGTVSSPNPSKLRVQRRLERMGCTDIDVSTSPRFLTVMREIVRFVDAVKGKIVG
jgi:hypothetical protein